MSPHPVQALIEAAKERVREEVRIGVESYARGLAAGRAEGVAAIRVVREKLRDSVMMAQAEEEDYYTAQVQEATEVEIDSQLKALGGGK